MTISLMTIQRALLSQKKLITRMFFLFELLMPVVWISGAYVFVNRPAEYASMYDIGLWLGKGAFFLYMLTLIPGILRRLRIQPTIQALIMPFRRHLGILMFLSAWVHMGLTSTIPVLFSQPFTPPLLTTHQVLGMIALVLLFPLWLTSNDYSQRRLKRRWKTLHSMTHIAMFFIFTHVALTSLWLGVIGLIVLVANLVSWGKHILVNTRQ